MSQQRVVAPSVWKSFVDVATRPVIYLFIHRCGEVRGFPLDFIACDVLRLSKLHVSGNDWPIRKNLGVYRQFVWLLLFCSSWKELELV